LKLVGGRFYHTKEISEEIEKIKLDDNYEILCSEPKLKEKEEERLEEMIEIDGKKVSKQTIKEALRNYL